MRAGEHGFGLGLIEGASLIERDFVSVRLIKIQSLGVRQLGLQAHSLGSNTKAPLGFGSSGRHCCCQERD